jgi:uncharacterized protein YjiS (DUF1127 family)
MSSLDCTEIRRRPFFVLAAQALFGRVESLLQGIRRWHAAGDAFRQLQSLSDEQLKDIGLHRSNISASSIWRRHAAD